MEPGYSIVAPTADVAGEIDDCKKSWKRLDGMETAARELPGERLVMGRRLVNLRKHWPARGPNAKGWGEALAKIGISQDTALRYMALAGFVEQQETSGDLPLSAGNVPTYAEAGIDKRPRAADRTEGAERTGIIGNTARFKLASIVKAAAPGDFFWVSVTDVQPDSAVEDWLAKPIASEGIAAALDLMGFPHSSSEVLWREVAAPLARVCPFPVEARR